MTEDDTFNTLKRISPYEMYVKYNDWWDDSKYDVEQIELEREELFNKYGWTFADWVNSTNAANDTDEYRR